MTLCTCLDILSGRAPTDTPVTLKGWVRTRRDSKAGISFVHVSDGSCFHPVQVVAPNTLANYADEIMHLTAGCALEATGSIVPSPAKGQPFEMQASAIKVLGWVEDPDTYPIQPKPHTHGIPARSGASAAAHQRHRRDHARAPHRRPGDPPFFPRARLPLGQHAHHHLVGRRGRGRAVPRVHARSCEPAAHAGGQGRFRAGLLRPRGLPHRVGTAQRRELLPGAIEGLHVRAHLPRGELQHQPPPGGVLDGRARNRFRRPRRQRHARRGAAQVRAGGGADGTRRRHGLLRRAHRERRHRQIAGHRRQGLRAHGLHRGDFRPGKGEGEIRVPGALGHGPAIGARALPRRETRGRAAGADELPEGDQGVLHARQRRRQDGGGDGRARTRHRRNRRRQPARGAPRGARRAHGRGRSSTRTTTAGIATCAAMAACRTPASASASSAPCPTSPASPTCAT